MLREGYPRALILTAIAALFLLFFGSGQPYSSDEVWSLRTVVMPVSQMMAELQADVHPPLFYWLLRFWVGLFGEAEIATRTLTILLGAAAAGVLYKAALEQYGRRAGMLAAVLFITSPLAIVCSHLLRMYTLVALAAALSMLYFLRLLRGEARRQDLALYAAANIAGTFSHVWFLFLLFAQGCAWLVTAKGRHAARMAGSWAVSVMPYCLLWGPVLVRQLRTSSEASAWIEPPVWGDLAQTPLFFGGLFCLALPFAAWKQAREAAVPALVCGITVLTPFIISFWKPIYWPRFTIVALPAFVLAGSALVSRVEPSRYALEKTLLAASCAMAVILSFYRSHCDARRVAEYLSKNTQTGDRVIFTNLSRLPVDYYWDKLQPRRRVMERSFPASIDDHPGYTGNIYGEAAAPGLLKEAGELAAEVSGGRIFLLHGFRPDADVPLKTVLDRHFPPVRELRVDCGSLGSYLQFIDVYSCEGASASRPRSGAH